MAIVPAGSTPFAGAFSTGPQAYPGPPVPVPVGSAALQHLEPPGGEPMARGRVEVPLLRQRERSRDRLRSLRRHRSVMAIAPVFSVTWPSRCGPRHGRAGERVGLRRRGRRARRGSRRGRLTDMASAPPTPNATTTRRRRRPRSLAGGASAPVQPLGGLPFLVRRRAYSRSRLLGDTGSPSRRLLRRPWRSSAADHGVTH